MRKFFDRGDVVFLDFDPSLGHEQKGRRPALILTKKIFNEQLRVACVAPITGGGSLARDCGFAVTLQGTGLETTGIVRCDQIQTLDLSVRNCQLIEKTHDYLIDEVLDRVISLFE